MRLLRWMAAGVLSLLAFGAGAQDAELAPAEAAAASWLEVQDAARYLESWERASPTLRAGVSSADWVSALTTHRQSLGTVQTRRLTSARRLQMLFEGKPIEIVVIQYDIAFVGGQSAVETVSPKLEADGSWKVSGYYIR